MDLTSLCLLCLFSSANYNIMEYTAPQVRAENGGHASPEKAVCNEDRVECVTVPFTPHAKPPEPQPAPKCVFNLLNQMARWQWHYLISCVCVCVRALQQVCVCLWALMDFSQDSDKPIYLKCKTLSLQILIQILQQIDDLHLLSKKQGKAHLKITSTGVNQTCSILQDTKRNQCKMKGGWLSRTLIYHNGSRTCYQTNFTNSCGCDTVTLCSECWVIRFEAEMKRQSRVGAYRCFWLTFPQPIRYSSYQSLINKKSMLGILVRARHTKTSEQSPLFLPAFLSLPPSLPPSPRSHPP